MDGIEERVQQVRLESERLTAYLQNLPKEAWQQQSACERWTVADVVAHLIGGAQMYREHVSRGLQDDIIPPEGFPPAGDTDPEVLGNLNAHRAIFRRAGFGDRLLSTFQSSNEQLNELLARLGTRDWDKPCYHPAGVIPVRTFVSLRMFELALHGWDMVSRLEREATLSAECRPMLLNLVASSGLNVVQLAVGNASPSRYRFRLSGDTSGDYDIVVAGGGASLEPAGSEPPDGVLRCDTADFLLLVTGRLELASAISAERLVIEQGNALPLIFGDWFKGVWRPREG